MVLVPRNLFGLWECCKCECDSIKIQAVGGGYIFFFPSFAPLCHKWRLENRHELSGDRYHQSVVESLNKNHDECVACYPPGGNGRKSHICIYKLPFRNKLPHVSYIYISKINIILLNILHHKFTNKYIISLISPF